MATTESIHDAPQGPKSTVVVHLCASKSHHFISLIRGQPADDCNCFYSYVYVKTFHSITVAIELCWLRFENIAGKFINLRRACTLISISAFKKDPCGER